MLSVWLVGTASKNMWLHRGDRCYVMTQMYNFDLKLTLLVEIWVLLSSCRLPTSTFEGSKALRKTPQRLWLHYYVCYWALTLTCQNHPVGKLWALKYVFAFWLPLLTQLEQHGCQLLPGVRLPPKQHRKICTKLFPLYTSATLNLRRQFQYSSDG